MKTPDCSARYPCHDDHDEPCFCNLPATPARKIRYSNEFVQSMRVLTGNHRWPLVSIPGGRVPETAAPSGTPPGAA